MTRDDLLARLHELQTNDDEEIAHELADRALLDFIGDVEVAEAFDAIKKWYA